MTLETRLRRMVEAVPDEGQILLPVATLREWLDSDTAGDEAEAGPTGGSLPDAGLTIADVAAHTHRTTSTVRGWVSAGRFPNAFRIGREWRIPRDDLAAFLAPRERESAPPQSDSLTGRGDLGAWRRDRERGTR